MTRASIEERLRDAGLRATAPRVAVLDVLARSDDHPRVDQVIERVRSRGVMISTQAAYDVCEALHHAALARRIALAGGPVRYEARVGDHHHHVVCRACGLTVDVAPAPEEEACLEAGDAHGYVLEESEVTYWGLCPTCQSHDGRAIA